MKKFLTIISASTIALVSTLGIISSPTPAGAAGTVTDAAQCAKANAVRFDTSGTWTESDVGNLFINGLLNGKDLVCIDGGVTVELNNGAILTPIRFETNLTFATTPGTSGQGTLAILGMVNYDDDITFENIKYTQGLAIANTRSDIVASSTMNITNGTDMALGVDGATHANIYGVGDINIIDSSVKTYASGDMTLAYIESQGKLTIANSKINLFSRATNITSQASIQALLLEIKGSTVNTDAYTAGDDYPAEAYIYGATSTAINDSKLNLLANSKGGEANAYISSNDKLTIQDSEITNSAKSESGHAVDATVSLNSDVATNIFTISGSKTSITVDVACHQNGSRECNAFYNYVMPTSSDNLIFYKDGVDMSSLLAGATTPAEKLQLFTIGEGDTSQFMIHVKSCSDLGNCPDTGSPNSGFSMYQIDGAAAGGLSNIISIGALLTISVALFYKISRVRGRSLKRK